MKKLFITGMTLFISSSIFLSCSKSSTSPSTPVVITGYWFGTYNTSSISGNAGVVFLTNGTTVVYNFATSGLTDTAICPLKYNGTYTVSGNNAHFTVTTPSLSTLDYTATVNISVNPNTMTGTFANSGGAGGSFALAQQ